jgi:hypothetical protein
MKKTLLILWLPLFFICNQNSFSQIYSDSAYVIESSPNYDFRNPVYNTNSYNFNGPAISNLWLAYERHNASSSNILIRNFTFSGYSNAVEITNDASFLNINPSFAGTEENRILVWQSNRNGNWDIYYSILQNGTWSAPAILSGTPFNETNPYISFDPYIQNAKYAVVYEREGEIWSKFLLNNGAWVGDTNTTVTISDSAFSPLLFRNSNFNKLVYLTANSNGKSLNTLQFGINAVTTEYVFSGQDSFTGNGSTDKLSTINIYSQHYGYSYDTLGRKQIFIKPFGAGSPFLDTNFSGDKSLMHGCNMMFITDNDNPGFLYFAAMALVRRISDSTQVLLSSRYNPESNNNSSRLFHVGNASYDTRIGLSAPVFNNFATYKMRVVWEQQVNGRTALVESYVIDFINPIVNLSSEIPGKYSLHQNYPNPFNPSTSIRFDLPKQGFVSLKVFDISGREVAELVKEELSAGVYEYNFDGSELGSGVYFYKLTTNNFSETKRMVLVK